MVASRTRPSHAPPRGRRRLASRLSWASRSCPMRSISRYPPGGPAASAQSRDSATLRPAERSDHAVEAMAEEKDPAGMDLGPFEQSIEGGVIGVDLRAEIGP